MSGFYIQIEKAGKPIVLPTRTEFTPITWSSVAVGGCEKSSINMSGPAEGIWQVLQWLGYQIKIYNHIADLVWWGHISRVEIADGAFNVGLELDSMSNRIRVAYTYSLADGTAIRGDTQWAQNDASIARYGIKELQHSGGSNITDIAASELRDSLLEQLQAPVPTIDAGLSSGLANGSISCRGDFQLMDWQYYTELRGLEESNTNGTVTLPIGYGFTDEVSWLADDDEKELWCFNPYLDGLQKDMVIDVTGLNPGTYTIESPARGEVESTTDTVSFLSDQDISDTVGIIGQWSNGDIIDISGSVDNNERRRISKIEETTEIKVKPKSVTTEPNATNVTIRRGYSTKLVEKPLAEYFNAASTITPRGYITAQSFQLSNNVEKWTCDSIAVRLKKVGNPASAIKLELRSGGAVAPSANVLASDTIAASEIFDTRPAWYEFDMGNNIEIVFGTRYWIVVSMDGANDPQNYYELSIDEERPYVSGDLKIGSVNGTWHDRGVNATMPFIVKSKERVTGQMFNVVTNYAQFINGVEFVDESTIETNQYRTGDTTALVEMKKFLEMGVNGGRRYICHVTPERRLVIQEEPVPPDSSQVVIGSNGDLRLALGGIYPAGRLPAGRWIDVRNPHLVGDALVGKSFFCERAEFDSEAGNTRVEPRRDNPFDISIRQG